MKYRNALILEKKDSFEAATTGGGFGRSESCHTFNLCQTCCAAKIVGDNSITMNSKLEDLENLDESSASGSDMEEETEGELSYHTLTDLTDEGDVDDDDNEDDDETMENRIRNLMMFPTTLTLPTSRQLNNYWNNFNLNINLHAILNNNFNSININLRNTALWKIYEHSLENFSKSTGFRIGRGNSETLDLLEEFPDSFEDIFISNKKGMKDPEEKFNLLKTKDSTEDASFGAKDASTEIEAEKSIDSIESDSEDEAEDDTVLLSGEYWASLLTATAEGTAESQILLNHGSHSITKAPMCPFFHRISYSIYDIIKICIGTVILAPIRFILMLLFISLAWCLAFIATSFISFEEMQTNSLSSWRRGIRWFIANVVMRIFFFCSGFHWITKKGKQASPSEAPILVAAPHSSYYDALPLVLMGAPSVVAKADTRSVPFFGKLVDLVQAVYVSRENHQSRHSTVKTIADRVEKIRNNENWPQIYIYPEGTCSNRSCLVSYKAGAFLPGAPIQPVLIKYPNRLDTITWTFNGPGAAKSLWLTLTQFTNHCELEFLPVYVPSEEEKKDANLYAANVRHLMAEAMNVPVVDYTFEDGLAMNQINAKRLIPKLKAVAKVHKFLSVSPVEEINILRKISSNGMGDWLSTKERFSQEFNLVEPDSALLDELYTILDQDSTGMIDMREFIVYACLLNPQIRVDQILPPFFLMFTQGRKRMSMDGFSQFMTSVFLLKMEDVIKIFNSGASLQQDMIDLEKFTKKTKKRLEYVKLLGLEVNNLLSVYPPRDREINSCKHSTAAPKMKSE